MNTKYNSGWCKNCNHYHSPGQCLTRHCLCDADDPEDFIPELEQAVTTRYELRRVIDPYYPWEIVEARTGTVHSYWEAGDPRAIAKIKDLGGTVEHTVLQPLYTQMSIAECVAKAREMGCTVLGQHGSTWRHLLCRMADIMDEFSRTQ